jgi:hypothetical protein
MSFLSFIFVPITVIILIPTLNSYSAVKIFIYLTYATLPLFLFLYTFTFVLTRPIALELDRNYLALLSEKLVVEKSQQEKDKTRMRLVEALVKDAEVEIPEVIVEAELDKMVYRLQGDIEQAGMKFDDYMAQLGKSTEEMRKELRPDAEKRAKFELVLHGIAEKEKLVPEEKEIEEQVRSQFFSHFFC